MRVLKLAERSSLVVNVVAVAEGNSIQQNNSALVEWVGRISLDQIPGLLVLLATRLLAETTPKQNAPHDAALEHAKEQLLNASELAQRLHLPESWVRTEERLGRLPSVRLGKYVRFRLSDVERALAQTSAEGRKGAIFAPFPETGCQLATSRLVVSSGRRWQASKNSI